MKGLSQFIYCISALEKLAKLIDMGGSHCDTAMRALGDMVYHL